jgi:hypothetical protein
MGRLAWRRYITSVGQCRIALYFQTDVDMKWVIGGLILAVVASVYSGRVPVMWVVYCFAVLFGAMGLMLFFAFSRNKHKGLLLLGCAYVAAAVVAVILKEWWPLVAGFAIAWVLRAMGLEPEPEVVTDAQEQAASPDGDKKT